MKTVRTMNILYVLIHLFSLIFMLLSLDTMIINECTYAQTPSLHATTDAEPEKNTSLYNTLITLQQNILQQKTKLKQIHGKNKATFLTIRIKLKQWNADKISYLSTSLQQLKKQYTPLFASYQLVTHQLMQLGKKNQKTREALRQRKETVKMAVQLARLDIEKVRAKLKQARQKRTQVINYVQNILANKKVVKENIQLEQKMRIKLHKRTTSVWKAYYQDIKRGNTTDANHSLALLISLLRQIEQSKQKLYQYEKQISTIFHKAELACHN